MSGSFDFLHIKTRTAGSSNELSLDVLEHKSTIADGKASRPGKILTAPKASQGSYHGVAGTSTLSGQAEVEKRKKARRSHRLKLQVAGAVVLVALAAAGIFAGTRYYESQADIASKIDSLVGRLAEVDETLVVMDAMMKDPLDAVKGDRDKLVSEMPKLTTELNRISVDSQSLLELPLDDRAEVAIGQIDKTAQSRIGMISAARDAFDFASEAETQVKRANDAWAAVVGADQAVREAVVLANKATTQEATAQALDLMRDARGSLASALGEMQAMRSTYGIDFSDQEAYLAKRVAAVDKSIETSEALLAGDRSKAAEANGEYNDADEEAARLAEGLVPSVGDVASSRLETLMADYRQRYDDVRQKTVETDAVIREYTRR